MVWMEMVRPPVKYGGFWLPHKLLQMSTVLLWMHKNFLEVSVKQKWPVLSAVKWLEMSPGVLELPRLITVACNERVLDSEKFDNHRSRLSNCDVCEISAAGPLTHLLRRVIFDQMTDEGFGPDSLTNGNFKITLFRQKLRPYCQFLDVEGYRTELCSIIITVWKSHWCNFSERVGSRDGFLFEVTSDLHSRQQCCRLQNHDWEVKTFKPKLCNASSFSSGSLALLHIHPTCHHFHLPRFFFSTEAQINLHCLHRPVKCEELFSVSRTS